MDTAKNGKEGLKWVPSSMQDLIIEAAKRLTDIGALARKAAKFAEENPNKVMISLDQGMQVSHYLPQKPLTEIEIGKVLEINGKHGIKTKWFEKLMKENSGVITPNVLGKYLYEKYTSKFNYWPYIDKNKNVKASEALLFRENEFHDDFFPKKFSFILPTVNLILIRMGRHPPRPIPPLRPSARPHGRRQRACPQCRLGYARPFPDRTRY